MNYTRITIHVFKLDDHSAAKPSCDVSFGIVSRSNGLLSPVNLTISRHLIGLGYQVEKLV